MKSPQNPDADTRSGPQQHFVVPRCAPFLEVRTTRDSTLPYAEHIHSAFSLGLILQGQTLFTLNGTEYRAQEGDIVLIAAGQTHSCNPVDGPRGYHMLLIDMDWLREHLTDDLTTCTPLIKDATLFPKAVSVIEAILAERDDAVSLLTDLLSEVRTQYGGSDLQSRQPAPPWSGLNPSDEANSADTPPLSVSALAKASGMRRESFSRAVRRKTGLPPSLYLHCLRLEKARRLLRQGQSITEAALASGYADQSHFHRMFVRFCAVTPGRYRSGLSHPYKK